MAKDDKHKGIRTSTALNAGSMAANVGEVVVPKMIEGVSTAAAQGVLAPAGAVLQAGAIEYQITEEQEAQAKSLGMTPEQFAHAAHFSNAISELRNTEDWKRAHGLGNAATSSGASILGGIAGQALIPIPVVGLMAGAVGGGLGASLLYNMALVGADKDIALLAVDIDGQHRETSREEAFALLASNLLPEQRKSILKDLKKETGHNNFVDALNGQGIPADIMAKYDTILRDYTQLEPDGTGQDVATQLASKINAGEITAKDLLVTTDLVRDVGILNQQTNMQITGGQNVIGVEGSPLPTIDGGTFVAQHEAGRRDASKGHKKPGAKGAPIQV